MAPYSRQTVRWVLDPDVFDSYRHELAEEVRRQGHEVVYLADLKPGFSHDDDGCSYRKVFPNELPVIFHGCIELSQRIVCERLGTPGAYATHERYYCSSYYSALGKFLLNQRYTMLPFGELMRCRDYLFEYFGRNGELFVRPDAPDKPFAGQLIFDETYEQDVADMAFYDVPVNAMVVVSQPVEILREWRFIAVNGNLIDGSLYKAEGNSKLESGCDPSTWRFAEDIVATGFAPDSAWVFDLCLTPTGQIALLEIGCFSHSDLYACNLARVVSAVSDAARLDWHIALTE